MIGISSLYAKLRRDILLFVGFMENKHLEFIIKACRLKPRDMKNGLKVIFYSHWDDEFGNSLSFKKDKKGSKKLIITLNDLAIDRSKLPMTDLYDGLPPSKISKISKAAFILVGKEEETFKTHSIVSFLGIDDFLRTFAFIDNEWISIPSLFLGIWALQNIAKHRNKDCKELKSKDPVLLPCQEQKTFIVKYPTNNKIAGEIPEWN
jgi:transposase